MSDTSGNAGEVRVRLALDATDLRTQIQSAERTVGAGQGIELKVKLSDDVSAINADITKLPKKLDFVHLTADLNIDASAQAIKGQFRALQREMRQTPLKIPVQTKMSYEDRAFLRQDPHVQASIAAQKGARTRARAAKTEERRFGGQVNANEEYLVGENGPEIVQFGRPGRVLQAGRSMSGRHMGGPLIKGHVHNDQDRGNHPVFGPTPTPYLGQYYRDPRTGRWMPTIVRTQAEAKEWATVGKQRPLTDEQFDALPAAQQFRYSKGLGYYNEKFQSQVVPREKGAVRDPRLDPLRDESRKFRSRPGLDDPRVRATMDETAIDAGRGSRIPGSRRFGRRLVLPVVSGVAEEQGLERIYQPESTVRGLGPEEWAAWRGDVSARRQRGIAASHLAGPFAFGPRLPSSHRSTETELGHPWSPRPETYMRRGTRRGSIPAGLYSPYAGMPLEMAEGPASPLGGAAPPYAMMGMPGAVLAGPIGPPYDEGSAFWRHPSDSQAARARSSTPRLYTPRYGPRRGRAHRRAEAERLEWSMQATDPVGFQMGRWQPDPEEWTYRTSQNGTVTRAAQRSCAAMALRSTWPSRLNSETWRAPAWPIPERRS